MTIQPSMLTRVLYAVVAAALLLPVATGCDAVDANDPGSVSDAPPHIAASHEAEAYTDLAEAAADLLIGKWQDEETGYVVKFKDNHVVKVNTGCAHYKGFFETDATTGRLRVLDLSFSRSVDGCQYVEEPSLVNNLRRATSYTVADGLLTINYLNDEAEQEALVLGPTGNWDAAVADAGR